MLLCNLSGNGRYAVPGGLPATLSSVGESVAEGLLPKGAGGVSATLQAAVGVVPAGDGSAAPSGAPSTATAYLALYAAPTTVGGADGLQVGDTSSITGLGATEQTLAVSVPDSTTTAPACYVWRLWVETTATNGVQVNTLEAT